MEQDIRQRDLSGKSLEQMTAEERRELRRRFEAFARARRKAADRSAEPAAGSVAARAWRPRRLAASRA